MKSSATSAPSLVESDEVYPVHMLDDTITFRGSIVSWTLRFNDVLDPDKLHISLSKLLEIGDWKKVGGRLRQKENGDLEIHVPRPFTIDRPAVAYSHRKHAVKIREHPLGSRLPAATAGASIQAGAQEFREFAAAEDAPATFEDFLARDVPQFSLHITLFDDATLVGLSWPHTLMDLMGWQALLRAWCLVLAGRDAEVPPVLGAREDVICAAADSNEEGKEEEEFRIGAKQLAGSGMPSSGARFAVDMSWNEVAEARTIFLPKAAVAELRRQVQADIASSNDSSILFVSDGDVLTAWATRAMASALPQPRPITVRQIMNARFRLPALVEAAASGGVFVQNMVLAAFTLLPAGSATGDGALGRIALENRRQLAEQSTEGQVLAFLRKLRRADTKAARNPSMLVCSEPDALVISFTNWTRAALFQTADFSPAVIAQQPQEGTAAGSRISSSSRPGALVYHHATSVRENPVARNVIVILGKDHSEGY